MTQLHQFIFAHWGLVAAFVLVAIALVVNEYSDRFLGIRFCSPADLVLLINRKNAKVIDIRDASLFKKGHIAGAMSIPFNHFPQSEHKLQKHTLDLCVLCCANGQESVKAARLLHKQGFSDLLCLKGGILAWVGASMPLVKS